MGDFFVVPILDVTFRAGGGLGCFTPDYPVASEDIVRSLKDARKQDKTASEVPQWLEARRQPGMGILSPLPKCQVSPEVAGLILGMTGK